MTSAAFSAALGLNLLAAVAGLVRRARLGGSRPVRSRRAGGGRRRRRCFGDAGRKWSVRLPDLLPLAGVRLALDPLGGLFLAVTGAVAVCAAVYGIGYTRHGGLDGRVPQVMVPVFVAAMALVPAASSVSTFLLAWELMALASLLLVVAEHRSRDEVRTAGLWYAVMTHLGLVVILGGLAGFAAAAHGESFERLRAAADGLLRVGTRRRVPRGLHRFRVQGGDRAAARVAAAGPSGGPSHVSALMSAAMVNLGVYGIVRVGFDLLGGG